MKNKNSYKIEDFLLKDEEIERLIKRTQFRIDEFKNALSEIKIKKNGKILEIGSGTGHRSELIAKLFPHANITGIDLSDSMIELSKKKFASIKNLRFFQQDIFDQKKLKNAQFDLIYMRLVLQHLHQPKMAIHSCYKLLKKGAYLIIEDIDRQLMVFHPSTPEWDKYYSLAIASQKKKGGDPYIGRKIVSYLSQVKFSKIDNLSYFHFGDQNFFNEWLEFFAPSYFNNLKIQDQKTARKCLKNLKKKNRINPSSFTQIWFMFRAQK